jgi:hypothetical protein
VLEIPRRARRSIGPDAVAVGRVGQRGSSWVSACRDGGPLNAQRRLSASSKGLGEARCFALVVASVRRLGFGVEGGFAGSLGCRCSLLA